MTRSSRASQAVTLATERYQRGLTDYLNVIEAERAEYSIEGQYAETQAGVDEQFIELYRDLGGGWQEFQKSCRRSVDHCQRWWRFSEIRSPDRTRSKRLLTMALKDVLVWLDQTNRSSGHLQASPPTSPGGTGATWTALYAA